MGLSASIVDLALYVANNHEELQRAGSSIVLYLPKIQTAGGGGPVGGDARRPGGPPRADRRATVKVYVLVEQLEATFQLMEIRAALGRHFVGFNTGRWDYINSVSDAMAWDPGFVNPDIEAITMTYGYMRNYEDRVRRAVNTADRAGGFALWQGGMEPNIPVGSEEGVALSMEKAVAGAEREQREGASGKWVAHWKMVHIVRPVWERAWVENQLGRRFPPLTHTRGRRRRPDAAGAGAAHGPGRPQPDQRRRPVRQRLRPGVPGGGPEASGLLRRRRHPLPHGGHGHRRDPPEHPLGVAPQGRPPHRGRRGDRRGGEGDIFGLELFRRLLAEEDEKLQQAGDRDVHDDSKGTTLPIAREIVESYVLWEAKTPWYIDLLNINLDNHDLATAKERIRLYSDALAGQGRRITENLDFEPR